MARTLNKALKKTSLKPLVEPGAVIDGFTIGECVHRGGMATLWRVTWPDSDTPMLMKVPLISEGEDPAAIVSFEMEQMILPRLSGPHVPACFGTGDFARQPYVVIERIPGKTLYQRLSELPVSFEEARALAGKIAIALADLHTQNVIHHDIKPSSIMFRPSGEAVLIDFGLSHHNQLPDLLQEEFRLPYGRRTWRRSGCSACATIRAATCFRSACSCTSSPRGCGRSASPRPCAGCGGGCGAIRTLRPNSGRAIRPGCRKWCCVAWRSSRFGATPPRRNWRSNSAIPIRSS